MQNTIELNDTELNDVSGGTLSSCMGCFAYGLVTGTAGGGASGAGGFSDAELKKAIDKLPGK